MLIEILIDPGKKKIAESVSKIQSLCSIPPEKIHRTPHISLYGGFAADYSQIERVKEIMVSVGRKYSFLPYTIDGFRWIDARYGRVVYFNIVASDEFKRFRQELSQRLQKIVPKTKTFDKEEDFVFHATLAYKLDSREFESVWSYVSGDKSLLPKFSSADRDIEDYHMRYFYLPLHALRATLLNDQSRLVCEYDFLQQRLLSRAESTNLEEWSKTLQLFRISKGIEEYENKQTKPPYLISDLHLDHSNIIDYCARPFSHLKVDEMNNILVDNWNYTVGNNDVYFLGDLSHGIESRSAYYWLEKLTGKIHFIRGSHDPFVSDSQDYVEVRNGRYRFLLVHDPARLPVTWNHWLIHGHKHNNDMENFPFINGVRKTINVSSELINYRPVSLDFLTSLKLDYIKRMDTIDSIPEMR
jgi:calcineurin-like phosphoesterase family protein/2'-5' RNA ligase